MENQNLHAAVSPLPVPAHPGDRTHTPSTLAEAYDMALRLEAAGDEEGALHVLRSARERYESLIRLLIPLRIH
jgi:hypothetical protein